LLRAGTKQRSAPGGKTTPPTLSLLPAEPEVSPSQHLTSHTALHAHFLSSQSPHPGTCALPLAIACCAHAGPKHRPLLFLPSSLQAEGRASRSMRSSFLARRRDPSSSVSQARATLYTPSRPPATPTPPLIHLLRPPPPHCRFIPYLLPISFAGVLFD
jgi:hypothetical protein